MIIRRLFQKMYCRIYLIILCVVNPKKNIVIAYGPAIGDTLFSLAYIHSLRNKDKKTIFVCSKGASWVCNYYNLDGFEIKTVSNKCLARIANGTAPEIGRGILNYICAKNLYITCARGYTSLMENNKWKLLDFLKYEVFKCDCDFGRPSIPQLEYKGLDLPKNSILLSFSNSAFGVKIEEWEAIASILSRRGFCVFTNCRSIDEKPINGTQQLVLSMEEMYNLANKFYCFIGMRSGFYDFVIDKARKIICINPDYIQTWWDLEQWKSNCKIVNIPYLEGKIVSEVIENV